MKINLGKFMRIPINRRVNLKQEHRRRMIESESCFRERRAIYCQLSLLDQMRIINRVRRERRSFIVPDCLCPSVAKMFHTINLSFKYAKQITDTILI